MTSVDVVICTHLLERWLLLIEALDSIKRQSLEPARVFVVVDGDAALLSRLKRRAGPEVVLSTGRRSGLSRARNTGVTAASAPLVAFLDDDAVADESWLERLVEAMANPRVLGASGPSLPLWERRPNWLAEELYWTVGCSYKGGTPTEPQQVRNTFGGCGVLRRSLFDQVGGFRTDFGRQPTGVAGGEEAEFCLRATAAHRDGVFLFEPAALILHRVPATRATPRYVLTRCYAEGYSKMRLRAMVAGKQTALGPERRYMRHDLPLAFAAACRAAASGERGAGKRAGVLAAAVAAAAAGGGAAGLAHHFRQSPDAGNANPTRDQVS